MAKKNILIIILTALVFLSAVTLGVATTYRIDDVCVRPITVSDEAQDEAQTLQARLKEAYAGQSTFFVDDTQVKEILADFPYFRLTGVERAYPNLLVVNVTEDAEVYAAALDGENYRIFNADGVALGERGDYLNRADGAEKQAENILLSGTKSGGAAMTADEIYEKFFPFCKTLDTLLDGEIRRNVTKIALFEPTSQPSDSYFRLTMREGVKIYVLFPSVLSTEKLSEAVTVYRSLSVAEKMEGRIVVLHNAQGVASDYNKVDNFDK